MPDYENDTGPSTYEHRGDECDVHGANVPHFRIKGGGGRFYCVACAQDVAAQQASASVSAVRPRLGVVNGHAVDLPASLFALEPERAAAEHVAVGLQRDLAVATAECARLRGEIEALKQSHEVQHAFWLKTTGEVQSKRSELMELRDSLQQQLEHATGQASWALQEQVKAVAALEDKRVERWHATVNAVLAGGKWMADAVDAADEMHGALVPQEKSKP